MMENRKKMKNVDISLTDRDDREMTNGTAEKFKVANDNSTLSCFTRNV